MAHLNNLEVRGFKSIRELSLDFRPLNVLIGANGSGKSNLLGVFQLLADLVAENLQVWIAKQGGADRILHYGTRHTPELALNLRFGRNSYSCVLQPAAGDSLIFADETVAYQGPGHSRPFFEFLGSGTRETRLGEVSRSQRRVTIADHVLNSIQSWRRYHFHDTGSSARVKQMADLNDNERLRADAGNLAPFLLRLQTTNPDSYRNIIDAIRLVAPFFDDFDLRPDAVNPRKIQLTWHEKGSDLYMDAHSLSDGTLRFMCLATLLLQPTLPTTILIDEPELGLHPYAITVLVELFRAAAERSQLLVATQSVSIVNQLVPDDVIVVDREDASSVFRRLQENEIGAWVDNYALGELWEKNVFGGRPA